MCQHCDGCLTACRGKLNGGFSRDERLRGLVRRNSLSARGRNCASVSYSLEMPASAAWYCSRRAIRRTGVRSRSRPFTREVWGCEGPGARKRGASTVFEFALLLPSPHRRGWTILARSSNGGNVHLHRRAVCRSQPRDMSLAVHRLATTRRGHWFNPCTAHHNNQGVREL